MFRISEKKQKPLVSKSSQRFLTIVFFPHLRSTLLRNKLNVTIILNIQFAEDTNRIDERASPTSMSIEGSQETVRLPATFGVKFLGKREARGLWGIKFTRKPVDDMVALAKNLKPGTSLPHLHFKVDSAGVTISEMPDNRSRDFETGFYPVDIISYGVQVRLIVSDNVL